MDKSFIGIQHYVCLLQDKRLGEHKTRIQIYVNQGYHINMTLWHHWWHRSFIQCWHIKQKTRSCTREGVQSMNDLSSPRWCLLIVSPDDVYNDVIQTLWCHNTNVTFYVYVIFHHSSHIIWWGSKGWNVSRYFLLFCQFSVDLFCKYTRIPYNKQKQ